MGAFEQLFGPGRGDLNKTFPKIKISGGCPGVMLKLRFDWYIKRDKLEFRTLVWKRTSNSYNISSFRVCSRLINVWEHIKSLAKNIREYSRNNQKSYDDAFNQLEFRFRFCWLSYQNSLSISFRSVKFHYVKEKHIMLVAFWKLL